MIGQFNDCKTLQVQYFSKYRILW